MALHGEVYIYIYIYIYVYTLPIGFHILRTSYSSRIVYMQYVYIYNIYIICIYVYMYIIYIYIYIYIYIIFTLYLQVIYHDMTFILFFLKCIFRPTPIQYTLL